MHLNQRITAFSKLGTFLKNFQENTDSTEKESILDKQWYTDFKECIEKAHIHNAWFTKTMVHLALKGWAENLTENALHQWLEKYDGDKEPSSKNVAVVMAGNLPLVGFHDFLSILICGHKVIAKLSSNDKLLLPYLAKVLIAIEPLFEDKIKFTEEKLPSFDAVIATGSNNTARYFEYYFKEKPHIIRKNRNGIAVLTGQESREELKGLANDIFSFYGMGCRSVSKIYLPEGYDIDLFFNAMFEHKEVINHDKYVNNYDYNKAVYLMGLEPLLDNNFMILKEDKNFSSPIAVVFYEKYENPENLKEILQGQADQIQCIVSSGFTENEIPFGQAQQPKLWDYADGVDTIAFLLKI
ncbi:acyl-CoA reductase [Flavimarina sp. Hel_I_48]|uniref:acyl-CoA reductase n=1 Tax=Flavimarina sp. Hel_I_48 TaxID=1392488 RepID=UPI0004DECC51|nr:acyl-CoA reductase [Flavimarina sp. Hel_I_48]